MHHIIFAPKTVIGTATPVSPPGTLPPDTTIPTVNPGGPDRAGLKGSKADKKNERGAVAKKIAVPAHGLAHRSAAVKAIAAILDRKAARS